MVSRIKKAGVKAGFILVLIGFDQIFIDLMIDDLRVVLHFVLIELFLEFARQVALLLFEERVFQVVLERAFVELVRFGRGFVIPNVGDRGQGTA